MLLVPSATASASSVHITHPPSSFFRFPPAPLPETLSPPVADHTLARPFNINPETYNNLLDVRIPITVALIYATTVTIANRYNTRQGNKPWGISKSGAFYAFVILHNVLLAIYSAWTFLGMANAVRHSWPGWNGEDGLTGVVDAMCKINGPRGLGNAATYNSSKSAWGVTNNDIKLLNESPDNTDVGRIWNEGLAYYGWLFYLSKFYEVVDTLIVLVKGKKSSILQTYHHAGAMMCVWAGIRYMSPPIWMFVFINSGIHALMYTYYTLSALSVPIPVIVKRTLTTLQIAQFVVGASYAAAHLFVAYSIPVNTPYLFIHNLSQAIPAVTSSISSAVVSATASAGLGPMLKKIALRAAGEEGLAENVRNSQGELFGIEAIKVPEVEKAQEETRYRLDYPVVNCIDTSGQAFAIWLNVLYLAPLTWLFVRFFIGSYIRRTSSNTPQSAHEHKLEKSSRDAIRGIEREIREAMDEDQHNDETEIPADIQERIDRAMGRFKGINDKVGGKAKDLKRKQEEATKKGKQVVKDVKDKLDSKIQSEASAAKDAITRNGKSAARSGKDSAGSGKDGGDSQPKGEETTTEDSTLPQHRANAAEEDDLARDEMAYEANIDELKGEAEEKAEAEMQPNGA